MKVKELLEMLQGKEEYDIEINDESYFEIDIDDELETITITTDQEYECDSDSCDGNCENCDLEHENDDENRWKFSNYEDKDINDWDVDDHLAVWFDHMMEK